MNLHSKTIKSSNFIQNLTNKLDFQFNKLIHEKSLNKFNKTSIANFYKNEDKIIYLEHEKP